jgi:hypothetical protein
LKGTYCNSVIVENHAEDVVLWIQSHAPPLQTANCIVDIVNGGKSRSVIFVELRKPEKPFSNLEDNSQFGNASHIFLFSGYLG